MTPDEKLVWRGAWDLSLRWMVLIFLVMSPSIADLLAGQLAFTPWSTATHALPALILFVESLTFALGFGLSFGFAATRWRGRPRAYLPWLIAVALLMVGLLTVQRFTIPQVEVISRSADGVPTLQWNSGADLDLAWAFRFIAQGDGVVDKWTRSVDTAIELFVLVLFLPLLTAAAGIGWLGRDWSPTMRVLLLLGVGLLFELPSGIGPYLWASPLGQGVDPEVQDATAVYATILLPIAASFWLLLAGARALEETAMPAEELP